MRAGLVGLLRGMWVVASIVLLCACAPDIEFFGDTALITMSGNAKLLETSLIDAARSQGRRLKVRWQPEGAIDAPWIDAALLDSSAELVILSPYFSLFAEEIASRIPDRHVVAYYGPDSGEPNLTRIRYEAEDAFVDLGAMVARWVFAASGRNAAAIISSPWGASDQEVAALEDAYRAESGLELPVTRFRTPPSRDEARDALRSLIIGEGDLLLIAMSGEQTQYILESAQSQRVILATRDGIGPLPEEAGVQLQVRDSLADGIVGFLQSAGDSPPTSVSVPAVLITAENLLVPQ